MSQSIVLQVGQCGNQIGGRFWDLVLQEQAMYNRSGIYDDSMSSFFRHVDERRGQQNLGIGSGTARIRGLKARGIMIDMEEGVVNQIMRSPIHELFDADQIITSVSGSGNNWAVGYHVYGQEYAETILEAVRRQAEYCDTLQSFFVIHSMGGGTGSGLGSYTLGLLADYYPAIYRFVAGIVPSPNDDVVTSPYNSIMSLRQMDQSADCVMPVDNQALAAIYDRIQSKADVGPLARKKGSAITDSTALETAGLLRSSVVKAKDRAFDTMNNIVANLLLNMTSSTRFEGNMNVDINDIVTNLVPFPRLKYLFSSMTPLYTLTDVRVAPRRLDQMFADAFSPESQLVSVDPRSSVYLASALIVRGAVEVSDLRRNIDRMRKTLRFVPWNVDGWKTGLCSVPPIGQPHALLSLSNNCSMRVVLGRVADRFTKLYRRKANLHHYLEHMETGDFDEARASLRSLISEYGQHEAGCRG
ncbi:tubulin, epsilon 1 [Entophlyctis helioformis]|nr:tubulin, epsilon 1 [Entophlyctis helioformis]